MDYLGGAETFLAPPLADAEGTPDGTEVAGGVMKWRVGLNWKVPMPDMDTTHGWITHRSARAATGQFGATVPRYDNMYHIWFPEGHTTETRLPKEGSDGSDFGNFGSFWDYPVVQEYMKEKWAKRRERLGKLAHIQEPPHIFPNMGSVGRIIRVLHPQGPAETEMWSYILVDKAAPPEVKEGAVRYHERRWGPNGMIQKDDMENWYILTQYSKGRMTRMRLRQNAQLGMSTPSMHGPIQLRHARHVPPGTQRREHPAFLRALGQRHGGQELGRDAHHKLLRSRRAFMIPTETIEDHLLRLEIEDFLWYEADLLDEHQYDEWLDLFTDDASYWMPIRRNVASREMNTELTAEGPELSWYTRRQAHSGEAGTADPDRRALGGEPFSRVTHMVSNMRVLGWDGKEAKVRCSLPVLSEPALRRGEHLHRQADRHPAPRRWRLEDRPP